MRFDDISKRHIARRKQRHKLNRVNGPNLILAGVASVIGQRSHEILVLSFSLPLGAIASLVIVTRFGASCFVGRMTTGLICRRAWWWVSGADATLDPLKFPVVSRKSSSLGSREAHRRGMVFPLHFVNYHFKKSRKSISTVCVCLRCILRACRSIQEALRPTKEGTRSGWLNPSRVGGADSSHDTGTCLPT